MEALLVDNAAEVALKGIPVCQKIMYLPRISAHAVKLINKCEARNTITFHLSVDCKSLTLHTRYAAYDKDSAV